MSRNVKKPCEFCDSEGVADRDEFGNLESSVEVYPEQNFIAFNIVGLIDEEKEVDLHYEIPMNYCPNCGRKLSYY